jgi:hypothetical protein
LIFDEISEIILNIRNGLFPKIEKEKCFFYGKKCCYFERCWGKDSNSLEGLVCLK